MKINSEIPREALEWASADSEKTRTIPKPRLREELHAPYHWYYYHREHVRHSICRMDEEHQEQTNLFVSYVETNFEEAHGEAKELFAKGLVSFETIPYLFEPGLDEVLHTRGKKFWGCRERSYIFYDSEDVFGDQVQVGHLLNLYTANLTEH